MLNKNNDDSSSSEDEISKNALKEATDHQFLKDAYFSATKSEISVVSEKIDKRTNSVRTDNLTNLKSLRKGVEQKDSFENFGVSPSFQNYVAKKLDEIIEKSITLKEKKRESGSVADSEENPGDSSGVKLLSTSIQYLTTEEEALELQKPQKRKIKETIDDKANISKCKEVAVDPNWILSKEETKAWTSKRRGPEFNYKRLKNGSLVEQT